MDDSVDAIEQRVDRRRIGDVANDMVDRVKSVECLDAGQLGGAANERSRLVDRGHEAPLRVCPPVNPVAPVIATSMARTLAGWLGR